MADSTLNRFVASGTTTARLAFTPTPPTPASGPDFGYFWFDTTDNLTYGWDGSGWVAMSGSGTVTNTGTLTSGDFILGNGGVDVAAVSPTAATALLDDLVGDSGSGGTKGLAPAPASGDAAAGKFLKADGTWTAPTAGGAMTQIQKITTTGSAGTIDFTGIPGTYNSLHLTFYGQLSSGVADTGLYVKFNNDGTAAHYGATQHLGGFTSSVSCATVPATTSGAHFFTITGTSISADASSMATADLHGYAGTAFNKVFTVLDMRYGRPTQIMGVELTTGVWLSTAAITQLTITPASGTFTDGTTAILYGVN